MIYFQFHCHLRTSLCLLLLVHHLSCLLVGLYPYLGIHGIITGYSVYCNTSANQSYPEQMIGSNVPTIRSVVNGTTLAATLSGLSPYTQYSCYVTANTSVGKGNPSAVFTMRTAQSGNLLGCYAIT